MTSWDRFEVYCVGGVFLCVGLAKILSYKRTPKPLGAHPARLPFGLPYGFIAAVGLFEVAAALTLVTPSGFLPQVALTQLALAGLALLTVSAGIYHARRHESTVPNVMLFLLVLFVVVVRWV
jgi:DoxX-like family